MESVLKNKLSEILGIWNSYIWKSGYCSSKIQFNDEARTNYFGDMFVYFQDTFEIISRQKSKKVILSSFERNIILLQAIYVQQDFIEELLHLFKTGINKGDLKKNPDYYINRQIRNELVGHPIRRDKGKLISSAIFGINDDLGYIKYQIYHVDNNFKLDEKTYKISELIERHYNFLNTYFDKIIDKLKSILKSYYKKLLILEDQISKQEFKKLLQIVEVYYEFIFKSYYAYDKDTLLSIYEIKDKHERYFHSINCFYSDLRSGIIELKRDILKRFNEQDNLNLSLHNVDSILVDEQNRTLNDTEIGWYKDLIGKLYSNRENERFNFYYRLLEDKFKENTLLLEELHYLKNNRKADIEYYTSLRFLEDKLIHSEII